MLFTIRRVLSQYNYERIRDELSATTSRGGARREHVTPPVPPPLWCRRFFSVDTRRYYSTVTEFRTVFVSRDSSAVFIRFLGIFQKHTHAPNTTRTRTRELENHVVDIIRLVGERRTR